MNTPSSATLSPARLEALADGVFAIAITLLILEIRLPGVIESVGLGSALRGLWPSYLGYVVSFVIIGIMWMNHHTIFRLIERVDHAGHDPRVRQRGGEPRRGHRAGDSVLVAVPPAIRRIAPQEEPHAQPG